MWPKNLALEPILISSSVVFSLGQGGYDLAFADLIDSHRVYCAKNDYHYACISGPGSTLLGRENIWLKALAFYGALMRHDYVLYVDTDVLIRETCPQFQDVVSDECPIGLVAGHSGRVNAGVIIAKRTPRSLEFFRHWVASLGRPIAARHDVGWGENGHLIRLAEEYGIPYLHTRWNNTFDPALDDHMRHYTGPLRKEYVFKDEGKAAWDEICRQVHLVKTERNVDIITSFVELKEVYERAIPSELFAPISEHWAGSRELVMPARSLSMPFETRLLRHAYVAENISEMSQNAYVMTLKDGLEKVLGPSRVSSGVEIFWSGSFSRNDILHIEWVESLFDWKVPDTDTMERFAKRIAEISRNTAIVYTAHNFNLMPNYAENRPVLMGLLAQHASMVCHLSQANIEPYNRHHADVPGLSDVPTAIVPHGDYQAYFKWELASFDDASLKNDKIKILVFGHIRTKSELTFCLDVAEQLGDDNFQMIFAGSIHPEILHWKENHRLRDQWTTGPRRIHFKVPNEQVVSLVSQCDGLLVPRFERLNSGVQFLGYSMLKAVFVPAENSMGEVQSQAVGRGIYKPHDVFSAAQAIRLHFAAKATTQLAQRFRVNSFNYETQDLDAVGVAHLKAYERAIAHHRLKFA